LRKRQLLLAQVNPAGYAPGMDKGLKRAIDAVGGKVALAKALGITHQALTGWQQVPPLRVLAVEKATGISREVLRPDLYPPTRRVIPRPVLRREP
jgi:DNA-binding transcriptional regulator YdaS (Cro superfamily)